MKFTNHLMTIFVAGVASVLAGCFSSSQPLTAPQDADYPLPKGSHFTESVNCAQPGIASLACDGPEGYRQVATGAASIGSDGYRFDYDKSSNPAFSLPAMQGAEPPLVLFKAIGDQLYVAQIDMGLQGGDGSLTDVMPRYLYTLVRIEGATLFIYKYLCEENGDRRYAQAGQLADVTLDPIGMATCQANSIAGLAAIFRDRLAYNPAPDEKIEIRQ